jgi:hypothetical protein
MGLGAMPVYTFDGPSAPRYRGSVAVPELDDLGDWGISNRQRPRAVAANRLVVIGCPIRGTDVPAASRMCVLSIELCDLK